MSSFLLAALGSGALLAASCSSSLGSYHCEVSSDCRSDDEAGGTCEATGFCSFTDLACGDSGRRYGEGSGELSNACVEARLDAGSVAGVDAGPGLSDASPDDTDADATPLCLASPIVVDAPGTSTYSLPDGCTTITVEAFGAGGGGAHKSLDRDSGAGGGSASGIQLGDGAMATILLAAGGGGGGCTDDKDNQIILTKGGGGGGGGYAQGQFTFDADTEITVVVGGGGVTNYDLPDGTGGHGGDPGGGNGGSLADGMDAILPWGGGGGGGDNGNGGSSSYGGGGGSDEDADGGDSVYGGAGSGGLNGTGKCGKSTFGGACNGVAGGGGGFYISDTGITLSGVLGSAGDIELGGNAAKSGPGNGGKGGIQALDGGSGKVIITPSN